MSFSSLSRDNFSCKDLYYGITAVSAKPLKYGAYNANRNVNI